MPLVQKKIINIGLNLNPTEKEDSLYIKKLIKNKNKKLANIPFVNNNLKYPYWLNYKALLVILTLRRKLSKSHDYSRYKIFVNSKDYVNDIIHSGEFKNCVYFDNKVVNAEINKFYSGDLSKGNYLDWLLTFYFWIKTNHFLK